MQSHATSGGGNVSSRLARMLLRVQAGERTVFTTPD